jgi:hypothetical protein
LRPPKRVVVGNIDRLVFAGLNRRVPEVLDALKILNRRRSSVGIAPVSERDGLEIATSGWPTEDTCGGSPTHS